MGAAKRFAEPAAPALRLLQIAEPAPERAALWRGVTAALVLLVTAGHLIYLARFCPFDLVPDEAHYWLWSRHLDWSYYSKGPLIAWLIRGSVALFGPWSQQLPGGEAFAVRVPAALCGGFLLAGLHRLGLQTLRREKQAALAVMVAVTIPLLGAGATLMTIDAPYTACWVWALALTWHAIERESTVAWLSAGVVVLLGILAKFTMALWVPCVGLYLLTSPTHRHHLKQWPFWAATAIAGLSAVPVVVWNAQHDWVTFRHVGWQAGVADREAGVRWLGPIRFLGEQAVVLLVWWFLGFVAALVAHRPTTERDPGRRFLWWMSAPVFGLFLVASFKTPGQMNWAVAAYLPGLLLAVGWACDRWHDASDRGRRWIAAGIVANAGFGILLSSLMHAPGVMRPALAQLAGPPKTPNDCPIRRFDPTCRLRGWHSLAEAVDRVRGELRRHGIEPVLAGTSWTHPGEIAFYLPDHPDVFCLGPAVGDRRSQLDFWQPNPLWNADQYRGQTFLIVGEPTDALAAGFERMEPPILVRYEEAGQPVAVWWVIVAHGYRGFETVESSRY